MPVSSVLLFGTIVVFVWQVTGKQPIRFADISPPLSFLTHSVLHLTAWHLVGNLAFFWVFGSRIEGSLKTIRFVAFLLGAMLSSSAAGHAINGPGVGLSGVVFALVGFGLASAHARRAIRPLLTVSVPFLLFQGAMMIVVDFQASHAGHAGGLLFGLVAGLVDNWPHRVSGKILLVISTVALLAGAIAYGSPQERIKHKLELAMRDWVFGDYSKARTLIDELADDLPRGGSCLLRVAAAALDDDLWSTRSYIARCPPSSTSTTDLKNWVAEILAKHASDLLAAQFYPESEAALEALVWLRPESAWAWHELGTVRAELGDGRAATEALEKAQKLR